MMTDEPTDQFKATEVADGFHDHDMSALARMTPAERAEQRRIRECLHNYVDAMWDHLKTQVRAEKGLSDLSDDPGYPMADDPAFSAVAGMSDLASALADNAIEASNAAGDDVDG